MREEYSLSGRNLDAFLSFSLTRGVIFYKIDRIDEDSLLVEISSTQVKLLRLLAKERAIKFSKVKPSYLEIIRKFLRKNIAFVITAILIIAITLSSHFFIFDIKIYGLENVKKEKIIQLLKDKGYSAPKVKNQIDVDNICHIIRNNIDLVSYVSAIIIGNCLIININEKIDTSPYIHDYPSIICPIDCIIEEIILTSGTRLKYAGDTALEGEDVIAPYVYSPTSDKIPTPAKAQIVARYNLTKTFKKEENNNLFEKNRNMLYNKLSNIILTSPTEEIISELSIDGQEYLSISLTGRFTFSE